MPVSFRESHRRQPDGHESALGLWVDRVGLHQDGASWFRAFRILGLHALCAVSAGTGRLRLVDGDERALRSGDAWWLGPEQAANYGPLPGTRWSHVALVFGGSLADTLIRLLRTHGPVSPGAGPAVEEAFRRLLPLAGRDGPLAAAARIAGLMPALVRFGSVAMQDDERIAEAVGMLSRHPAGALDTTALARRVGLGASQLRRLFVARYGMSPSAWLMRLRLERARDLLATTDLSVGAVAQACGYEDPFWFSRAFRRASGASPQAWRGKRLHDAVGRDGPPRPRR
jgi:AraC family transcriptional regulator, arabinose operon regulatory protein